ncbi:tetratricopeptide repeat protein [Flavobacterium aquidurense]|uniref:tetratricopeptide repeat protein n=1 Tax=Flavobacterium aquidurense TaxID=362413 RepID=UPI0037196F31
MLFRKSYCVLLLLFILQVKSQNPPIKIPCLENKIANIEAVLLQEKSFDTDTISLKKHLELLGKSQTYKSVYDGLLANGYSDFYNTANSKSKFYYSQSIKSAAVQKDVSLEIWAELNYISYLYLYRDYINMTPKLLQVIDKIKKTPANEIILPGESFKKIGWMLQTLEDYPESLYYLNLAKKHTAKNTTGYASLIDNIGMNYFRLGNDQEAESYFNQAGVLAKQIQDELQYAKALGNLALVKQKKGDLLPAISLLKKDIEISEEHKSNQNTMYASILLAELYVENKELNQAEKVLKKAAEIANSKSYFKKAELQIIKLKLAILDQQKRSDNELVLRRRMVVLEDSLKNKDGDLAIRNANWIIQKTKFQQNINKTTNQVKHETAIKKSYAIVIVLAFMSALFIFFSLKKQLRNRQRQYNQKVNLLKLEKIKTEQKLHETNENFNAQVDYLKDKNIQIKKLKVEIEQIKKSSSHYLEKEKGQLNTLLESHLMTENNWNTFKREFQKEYPEFSRLLQQDFPEITDANKRILLLQKLNFSNNEIAELLGITPDAVKKSKQRLKKKLGSKFDLLFEHLTSKSMQNL